ncbi:SDR family NAD(P)-dependent oxidoreductase [Janthinobacterium lividum]|uniref:SDR family NAD(P)-dependent oxidoreductase n=1 Tax=Janthinobacterium lividum TaxID=29581 RepID=UPI00087411A3|nr:SDR family NAD(P)-dependent oxidoreductase [Janthinobacterium lividum]MCC7716675.1 SDR family NAD(P)-dependent oxidoreductase [Janthinobacterium lividum]OEZ51802.1 polyketide synthase PksL [Janthinobacterium lividum]WQE31746.1 SDR family NAD(P)-dependent oxidoreductase [Janthinobacterium lividum]STS86016.1 Polyketide synthase PksL [Janthinobacterium lividum]
MDDIKQLLSKSVNEIKRLKAVNRKLEQELSEPIAIVGTACRYPGDINSLEQLWEALSEGKDCIGRMTDQRWPMHRFLNDDAHQAGSIYTDAMGMLSDIDRFDPAHFGLKTEEARHLDPQHRLLMELAWETFEDAGYAIERFAGSRTGVYVGIMSDDYGQLQGPLEAANYYIGAGMARSCAAGRLAFTFGLEGPALALDTACSSSLVGVHLAVQALRRGECDAALAGGVNLILSPQGTVVACRSQMLSRSGRCQTFDAGADGYVRSEGCGLVLLKRLSDAQRDGDRIYALVRGSAVNHDGRTQGLTAPSGQAQRRVIAAALADAGVAPGDVDFVECHGTGTALGDPIEVRAIEASYVHGCEARKPLLIGALKSNLGHMEAAAGIGGLHKAIQVVRHRHVPKNLHFQTINPQIQVDLRTLHIAAQPVALQVEGVVLAGVSSFGFSGTNAHIILESYVEEQAPAQQAEYVGLFRLAARSHAALGDYAGRYLALLEREQPLPIPALCRTAAIGRSEGGFRLAFTVGSREDLRACLQEYLDVTGGDHVVPALDSIACAWVIGGQKDVDWTLAGRLYDSHTVYRATVEQAYAYLQPRHSEGLAHFRCLLEGGEQTTEALPHAVHRWALAKLLAHFGLFPCRITGSGFGEYIAAAVAGLLDWQDMLDILFSGIVRPDLALGRSRCDFVSTFGKAASLPEAWQVGEAMANANQEHALVSGGGASSDSCARIALTSGLSLRLTGELDERIFRWVHGNTNRNQALPLENFLAHCYMAGLALDWEHIFGDQPALRLSLPTYPFQRERIWTDWAYMFDATLPSTVGQPDLARVGRIEARTKEWGGERVEHPILHSVFSCPSGAWNFSGELSLASMPFLAAHRMLGEALVPASLYLDLVLVAVRRCWPGQALQIDEMQLLHKCVFTAEPIDVYCHVRPAAGLVEIYSKPRSAHAWQQHVRAKVSTAAPASLPDAPLEAYRLLCEEPLSVRRYYQNIAQIGLNYGADFQGIFELSRGERRALAKIALPPSVDQSLDGYLAHPILLDACLQAIAAASQPNAADGVFVPSQIKGVHLYRPLPEILWCLVEVAPVETPADGASGRSHASLTMLDTNGACVMRIDRFETQRYATQPVRSIGNAPSQNDENYTDWLYEKHWVVDEAFDTATVDIAESVGAARAPSHWLLFSDQGAACDALEAKLTAQGDHVSVLCLGEPAKHGRLRFAPQSQDDVGGVFDIVEAGGAQVNGVIYGWSLTDFGPLGSDGYTEALDVCAKYPLWLSQAILGLGRRSIGLSFLTRGSQPAGEACVTQPLAALLWGHVAAFVNENRLFARLVDLDPDALDESADVALLVRTLNVEDECQVALRRGRRLLARLRPGTLELTRAVTIDPAASYLITGGFGALGMETARELVRQGARHLVLVGRSTGKGDSDPLLQEIHAAGARTYPLQADIGDRADFVPKLAALLRELPPLKGVIHSAGVLDDGVVGQQNWERYQSVFGPKVGGTLHLHLGTRGQPLDFFILYSSAAAILGNPGQANYAAANAFMDSFAWYLRGNGLPGMSINWGGWSQIGIAAGYTHRTAVSKDGLLGFIPPEQGAQVIAHQFASTHTQFAVLPLRRNTSMVESNMPYLTQLLGDVLQDGHQEVSMPDSLASASHGLADDSGVLASFGRVGGMARHALVKQYVSRVIAVLLNASSTLDDRASLFDLGLDSLLSIDLRLHLEKNLDCSLSSTLLHDYPTIDTLTNFLLDNVIGHGVSSPQEVAPVVPPRASETAIKQQATDAATVNSMLPATAAEEEPDIAIIGISGRFPGAPDLETFWENLRNGCDSVTEIPADRWNHADYFDKRKNIPGKSYSGWGGFINDVDQFDPEFFNISPRMAAFLDPKERLFLETVWNMLEDAAYTRGHLRQAYGSKVGVFVGAMYQLYGAFAANDNERAATALSSYNAIANRISYFFDLRGPSLAVDTMCSSSLTAIHLACQSLLDGDCELAIAGGVNLSIHPRKFVALSQAQIIGSHAGSRSFSDGDGYLPAEAVGAVLLKPLAKARRDGDRVLAVIKASSINHGGRSTGYFAPNAEAQVQLIEANFSKAGIDPASIGYVEAAANGATLGDSTELRALRTVFANAGVNGPLCPIGTVKSNIGHAEAASGMAQLAKVVLQLKHRMLVPSIKTEPRNPNIDFATTQFHLLDQPEPWVTEIGKPRRATISSFGAGGANAHLIIEEYIGTTVQAPTQVSTLAAPSLEGIVLSARTTEQLAHVAQRLLMYLNSDVCDIVLEQGERPITLSNIAYTLQTGREEMDCRLALLVGDLDELRRGLGQYLKVAGEGEQVCMYSGNVQDQLELRNLLSSKAGEAMAQALAADGQLQKLMLHWVQGGKVPWEALRRGQPVQYVTLPTYPFARSRYWLSGGVELSSS